MINYKIAENVNDGAFLILSLDHIFQENFSVSKNVDASVFIASIKMEVLIDVSGD